MCGGYSSGYRKDCYEFSSNSWTRIPPMTGERRYFGMIYLKEKVYAVAGHGSSGSENSMEIFDSTTRKWKKQSIPFSVQHHCITQLSANQFILIGGCKGRAGVCGRRVSKNVITKSISIQQFHFYISLRKVFFYKLSFFEF